MVQQNSIFVLAMVCAEVCISLYLRNIIRNNVRTFRDQSLQYPFRRHGNGHRVLEAKVILIILVARRGGWTAAKF